MTLEDETEPSLVVEDYYSTGNDMQFLGMAEDGQLYAFMSADGTAFDSGYLLADGQYSQAALGGNALGSGSYLFQQVENGDDNILAGIWPWLLGVATIATAAGIIIANQDNDDGNSPAPAPSSVPAVTDIADNTGAITGSVEYNGVTDEQRPVITGSGEAGSIITVYDNGTIIGTTTVDANGKWTFTPDSNLSDGKHEISATQTNSAGAVSQHSDSFAFTVDTLAPEKPLITSVLDDAGAVQGALTNGAMTDDTRPEFSGSGEAGCIITFYINDVAVGSTTVDSDGNWSFTPSEDLSDGHYQVYVTQTDKAGNVSEKSATFDFDVNTARPDSPTFDSIIDDVGPITGEITDGSDTDDTQPTFSGEGEPGDTITFYDNDEVIGSTTVDEHGEWSFTPDTPLDEGEHAITIIETDEAGNASEPSDPISFTIDTTEPAKPEFGGITDDVGPITGDIVDGGITDDTQPTFSGEGEPGDTITFYDNDEVIGSTTVDENGEWSFTPDTPLDEGEHAITIIETDEAGNASEPSDPISFTIDTTEPAKPEFGGITDDVGPITGDIVDGGITDDTQPTFSGEGEPGDTITFYDNDEVIGSTTVDEHGEWSFTPDTPLDEGEHAITIIETDEAGNASEPSDPISFTIDTTEPAKPEFGGITDDVGPITGDIVDGGVTDDTQPTFSGEGEPGDTITFYDNDEVIGSTTVDEHGEWSFTPDTPLDEGEHAITIIETDEAGNASEPSDPISFTIDTTEPAKPEFGGITDDVGPITGDIVDGGVTDDTQPTFSGEGEPGDTITFYDNDEVIGSTTVDEHGEWSFTPDTPLDEGEHAITIIETDEAGNASEPSDPISFTIDTTEPAKPEFGGITDDVGPITGDIVDGGVTDDTQPTFSGEGEPGDTITFYDNDEVIGSTTVDEHGEWSFTPDAPLDEGEHAITIIETDEAGNASEPSDPISFTVDTTEPAKPEFGGITDDVGPITGDIVDGGITDDTQPTFSGEGEPGDTITFYDNDEVIGSTTVDEHGEWSFTPDTPLDEGEHAITIIETDEAGNASEPSDPISFTVDTTEPAKPEFGGITDDVGPITGDIVDGGVTDDTQPTFSGEGEPGDTITFYDNDEVIGSTTVDEHGEWSFTPDAPLDEGEHAITIIETDEAGNASEPSDPISFTVDTTEPAKPELGGITDDVGPITGDIVDGGVTDDTQPTFSGEGEPGDTITFYDNDEVIGSTTVDEHGEWSFTPDTPLDEGEHAITIIETDEAGNASEPSDPISFTVDTTPPDEPVLGSVIDDVGTITGKITDGGVTDDTQPTFNGEGEPDSTITFYDNGDVIGSTTTDENGHWSFTPDTPLSEGEHEFTMTATDEAGNTSAPTEGFSFTVDITPPNEDNLAITGVDDQVGEIKGNVASGGSTDDSRPTISGTGTAGDTIVVYAKDSTGNHEIGRATVAEDGTWTLRPASPLLSGNNDLTAVEIDPAGNATDPCAKYSIALDSSRPTPPVIVTVVDDEGAITGTLQKGDVTDDSTPTLNGTAQAGSTVRIYDGATLLGSITATRPATGALRRPLR
ncbi:Ig-like domain-containing protein [Leminorella grimontii]|uniref:Ig-like domain-containing protein n=1 Tax=Leminorella grimontii TaxID=82981 RepID=UPI00141A8AE5|nr:Ig-like domain-containing protein [Leminorella grimontii]